jgi:hypothetical protein
MNLMPLVIGAQYAELLDLCQTAQWDEVYPPTGSFRPKESRGRSYWYFQPATVDGHRAAEKYVGPDSEALRRRIEAHRGDKQAYKDRRTLVTTLVRGARFPAPPPAFGDVLRVLSRAGVFRLRACLVGTLAFQTYGPMLGARLAASAALTADIDIAQYHTVSVAIGQDEVIDLGAILRAHDDSFRPLGPVLSHGAVTAFVNARQLRVDILTANQGSDDDTLLRMPALGTDAVALRFLDFLIHEPVEAVVLHDDGIPVVVPAPERYAVHKLIISGRRQQASAKAPKDIVQAGELLHALHETSRWSAAQQAFEEACRRGPTWRELAGRGLANATDHLEQQASGKLRGRLAELADAAARR